MTKKEQYLVLGLDPGIAGTGLALIDTKQKKILEMISHTYDIPQNKKNKKSLAKVRREYRSARRNNSRTKGRLRRCFNLLVEANLVPEGVDQTWLQQKKGDRPILELRAKGLDALLTDREFAQVLYSLCGHRGYIPHGQGVKRVLEGSKGADNQEEKKVLKAIKENNERLRKYRTVGEMFFKEGGGYRNKAGSYSHCVLNQHIIDEVNVLFKHQNELGNRKAPKNLREEFEKLLIWEMPSVKNDEKSYSRVGNCVYYPKEKRAASASISSEMCNAYAKFGHLVIIEEDGTESFLPTKKRHDYIGDLFSLKPKKVTYAKIRKDLDLSGNAHFKGIDQDQEKSEVFIPKGWQELTKSGLSQDLLNKMLEDRKFGDDICEAFTFASTEDSLRHYFKTYKVPYDFSALSEKEQDNIIELLKNVSFSSKVFKGYGKRSRKALDELLGAFCNNENIRTLSEAEEETGLRQTRLEAKKNKVDTEQRKSKNLLPPYSDYDKTCTNPVVLRALSRMRKMVNAIIREYGVPNEIHIELARELKHTAREEKLINKRNKANQATNERLRKVAAEGLGVEERDVPKALILKLALREEQSQKDLYTGETINLDDLLENPAKYEIDHILPYSRTADDNRTNKVLTTQGNNQSKGARTPYEWMTSEEENAPNWERFAKRVQAIVKDNKKKEKLLEKDLENKESSFLERNLNDTRYMSVAVKNYLEDNLNFPDNGKKCHVYAVAGGATNILRWSWELPNKERDDNRHHAVDAAVIAACSTRAFQTISRKSSQAQLEQTSNLKEELQEMKPWPAFNQAVKEAYEELIPTKMANHGVTGSMYQDKLKSFVREDEKGYLIVKREDKKYGNARLLPDGKSVQIVGGMAFLRLWLDVNGSKGKGKWYVEPVYYADMPNADISAVREETYVPKYAKSKVSRSHWPKVPTEALKGDPIVLFSGDVLAIDNHIARYVKFGIRNQEFTFHNLLRPEKVKMPTLSEWTKETRVRVLEEDILARCYDDMRYNPDDSTYSKKETT